MKNKIVVITGASQGIGEEIAKAFSQLKNITLLLLARSAPNLKKVAETCRGQGIDAHSFVCDVTDEVAVKKVSKEILAKWGAPDVLVNNAGQYAPSKFTEISVADFKAIIDVNLTSAFIVTQAFLPSMLANNAGDIFFICSIASLHGYNDSFAYCAAKHGLLGLARTLRMETLQSGLRIMSVMPGATLTPAWDNANLSEDKFIPAADIGKIIVDLHQLHPLTNVEELVVRPRPGDVK